MVFSRGLPKTLPSSLSSEADRNVCCIHRCVGVSAFVMGVSYTSVKPPESPYICPAHSRKKTKTKPHRTGTLCEIKLGDTWESPSSPSLKGI